MASGMLGTAISGLQAFQRSLETTSHNISNVNTDGYSRQRVELGTSKEQKIGGGYLGTGVSINNISRSYNQFIITQLRSSTATFGDVDKYSNLASQVDNIVADPTVGMAPALKNFFNAVNDAADDPSSIPSRQVLLAEAEILGSRFETINSRFEDIRKQINTDMVVMADEITGYAATIAELNIKISNAMEQADGTKQPNDLLDQRDTALNNLAELIEVSVVPGNNGMVSVFMGQGEVLVLGGNAEEVVTQTATLDSTALDIGVKSLNGAVNVISSRIRGGALGGVMRFSNEVLGPAQQRLGAVAASVAMEFNTIHEQGYDIDGVAGEVFFKGQGIGTSTIPVAEDSSNSVGSSITVMFDKTKISDIDYSDYELDVSAGPAYKLTRVADSSSIDLTLSAGFLVPVTSPPDKLPGISIAASGLNDGDKFLIRPVFSVANTIAVNFSDPRKIALATNQAVDSANNTYTITGPMPGDNRNGLALAALETKQGMLGGTASFGDGYGLVVSEVGVKTNSAKIAQAAQETLLNSAKGAWADVSGVNLDEEAANLIKFQQSYQAAAQLINVSNTLFDALIGSVR